MQLNALLHQMGYLSPDVLVVQAGVHYPETVTIFAQDSRGAFAVKPFWLSRAFSRLMVLLTFLSVFAGTPSQASKQDDIRALQGTWLLRTVEWLGEKTDQDDMMDQVDIRWEYLNRLPEERELKPGSKKYRTTLTIKGNAFVFRQMGRASAKGQLKLHVDKEPKVMERRTTKFTYFVHEASWSVFPSEDTYYSIYSLEGDSLKWCYRRLTPGGLKDLPTKFATDRDEDVFLLTFRREK